MTDLNPPEDDRETARRVAAAYTAAARDVEAFLRRMPAVPTPADVAEYATLLAREEAIRVDRDAFAAAAGLQVPSIEG